MKVSRSLWLIVASLLAAGWFAGSHFSAAQTGAQPIKGWKQGVGWGWIWGKEDEVGALNAMTDALALLNGVRSTVFPVSTSRQNTCVSGAAPGERA